MEQKKQWTVGQDWVTALKNVLELTKAPTVTCRFDKGKCTISSLLSYYGAEITVDVQGQSSDTFDVRADLLVKAVSGKKQILLARADDNTNWLTFVAGQIRGEIPMTEGSDVNIATCEQGTDVMEIPNSVKDSLFSVFSKLKISSKKVNLDKLDLQVTVRDGKLMYFVGDPYYVCLYEGAIDSDHDITLRILLQYMVTIEKVFKKSPFKIGASNGIICVQGDNVVLNFPQITFDSDMLSIESVCSYKKDLFNKPPVGAVLVKADDLKDILSQGASMYGEGTLTLVANEQCGLKCSLGSDYGTLSKTTTSCKVKGSVNSKLDLLNIKDCLDKLSGTIKLSFYDSCCLIKTKGDDQLSYILSFSA